MMKQCLLKYEIKKIWYELGNLLGKLKLVLLKGAKLFLFCTQIISKAFVFSFQVKLTTLHEIRAKFRTSPDT